MKVKITVKFRVLGVTLGKASEVVDTADLLSWFADLIRSMLKGLGVPAAVLPALNAFDLELAIRNKLNGKATLDLGRGVTLEVVE